MLSFIIQISFISVIFIFLVHHLILFFKSTLTVPKIKDLVNSSNQKYQHIYDTLSHKNDLPNSCYTEIDLLPSNINSNINSNGNNSNLLNENGTNSMKDELKHFLKKQLKGTNNDIISGVDSSSGNFSTF